MPTTRQAGLAASFYACDVGRIWRVAEALESGRAGINEFIELKYLCFGDL